MKKLGIVLVVLLVIGVVVDALARAFSERAAANVVGDALNLDEDPSIELGGFPFLFRLVGGNFTVVRMVVPSIEREGVRIEDVELRLHDVDFSIGKAVEGSPKAIKAARGSGSATLSEPELNEALRQKDVDATVTLGDRVTVRSPDLPQEAGATITLEGSRLVIKTDDGLFSVALPLPQFASGLTYEAVTTEPGRATIEFAMAKPRFDI